MRRLAGRENGAPGWACVQSKRPRAAWKRHAGSHHAEMDRTVRQSAKFTGGQRGWRRLDGKRGKDGARGPGESLGERAAEGGLR